MARWIEIPAHRVLEVERREFESDYEMLGGDGNPVEEYAVPAIIRRRRDERLFKMPQFHIHRADYAQIIYLEEF